MDIFEKASKVRIRFASTKGLLTTEDLWALSLRQLNTLAKGLNKTLKDAVEEDFLEAANKADTETKLGFDIVLHILRFKEAEGKTRAEAADKKAEKAKLLAVLDRKQDASLEGMTEEQIKQKIDALG